MAFITKLIAPSYDTTMDFTELWPVLYSGFKEHFMSDHQGFHKGGHPVFTLSFPIPWLIFLAEWTWLNPLTKYATVWDSGDWSGFHWTVTLNIIYNKQHSSTRRIICDKWYTIDHYVEYEMNWINLYSNSNLYLLGQILGAKQSVFL